MARFALELELDGARFCGTALQPEGRSVSAVLRAALARLDYGRPVLTRTCGRLDAGVDAEALVAHADLERPWSPATLGRALNGHLPEDLRCVRVAAVDPSWDALHSCRAKTYRYAVATGPVAPARTRAHCLWLPDLPHVVHLPGLAGALVGCLDLGAFAARRGDDSDEGDGHRRIDQARWLASPRGRHGQWLHFRITGAGFLYKQVRGLVGAMLAVASGRGGATVADFHAHIAAGRHAGLPALGQFAPARGLCLEAAHYRPEPDWQPLCFVARTPS